MKRTTIKKRTGAATDLYRFMGLGRLDLSGLNESGGIAYSDSSYYVTGWLAKYGSHKTPGYHLTCGFMSGYDANVINNKVAIEEGLEFISKPILPDDLLRKVRVVLDK